MLSNEAFVLKPDIHFCYPFFLSKASLLPMRRDLTVAVMRYYKISAQKFYCLGCCYLLLDFYVPRTFF